MVSISFLEYWTTEHVITRWSDRYVRLEIAILCTGDVINLSILAAVINFGKRAQKFLLLLQKIFISKNIQCIFNEYRFHEIFDEKEVVFYRGIENNYEFQVNTDFRTTLAFYKITLA